MKTKIGLMFGKEYSKIPIDTIAIHQDNIQMGEKCTSKNSLKKL